LQLERWHYHPNHPYLHQRHRLQAHRSRPLAAQTEQAAPYAFQGVHEIVPVSHMALHFGLHSKTLFWNPASDQEYSPPIHRKAAAEIESTDSSLCKTNAQSWGSDSLTWWADARWIRKGVLLANGVAQRTQSHCLLWFWSSWVNHSLRLRNILMLHSLNVHTYGLRSRKTCFLFYVARILKMWI